MAQLDGDGLRRRRDRLTALIDGLRKEADALLAGHAPLTRPEAQDYVISLVLAAENLAAARAAVDRTLARLARGRRSERR